MTTVELLVTGLHFIRAGVRAIEPVLEEIIMQAEKEIHMIAYIITPSALPILNLIEKAVAKGVKFTMVVNNLQSQNTIIVSKLNSIMERFPHVRIVDFTDPENGQLHAKVVIADRRRAVIGSANLSWGGMYSNHEIGLLVEGEVAWKLAEIIDSLCVSIGWRKEHRCKE